MRRLLSIRRPIQNLNSDHIHPLHSIQLRQKLNLLLHHRQTLSWIMSLASLATAPVNQSVLRRLRECSPCYVQTHHVCRFKTHRHFHQFNVFFLVSRTTRDFQVFLYSNSRSPIFAFNSFNHTQKVTEKPQRRVQMGRRRQRQAHTFK